MLLKNIIVIENFTCNIVFSEANLSLSLVNILQNYIAEMSTNTSKTWDFRIKEKEKQAQIHFNQWQNY